MHFTHVCKVYLTLLQRMFKYIVAAFFAGFIAVIGDILIRQNLLEKVVERDRLPEVCKQYRRTVVHIISLFIVGVSIYVLVHLMARAAKLI